MNIVILQHGEDDPPERLGQWLREAGVEPDVRRLYDGDPVPDGTDGIDGLISLGGAMGAYDDDDAPWLPATRALLADAVRTGTPTLGICLGAQLLAVAAGGQVGRGPDGPEIGAYFAAKRDVAETDELFAGVPISPDVMQYHYDIVTALPRGATLLYSSIGYPTQAFRIGSAAWGVQFHIETSAATLRRWRADDPVLLANPDLDARFDRRCGAALDEAEEMMGQSFRAMTHRFVELARTGVTPGVFDSTAPRLPLLGDR